MSLDSRLSEVLPWYRPDTGLDDSDAVLPRRAAGYENGRARKPVFVHAVLAGPAGGAYSTIGDLYRWDQAL